MPGMGQGLGLSGSGEGAGDGSGDGSGGGDWSSGSDTGTKSRRKSGSAPGADAESIKVLEEARIGEAPSIYQPDDVYFVGEVTFEVELRDPKGTPAPAAAEGTQ